MWAVAVIFLSVLAMGILYFLMDSVRHTRAEKAKHESEIKDAQARLDKALQERPYDVAHHASLRDELLRVQGRK